MATPPHPPEHHHGWLWLFPRLAFLLFVAVVASLLWLSNRSGVEEQRATLISDMLWLEQDLHFQLSRNEELLGAFNPTIAANSTTFTTHAKSLVGNHSGLQHVRWLDVSGRVLDAYPNVGVAHPPEHYLQLAFSRGRAVYGDLYQDETGDWQIDTYVPIFKNGNPAGLIAGRYSLQKILDENVPWWLTEKYQVTILNNQGQTLASRSKVRMEASDRAYQLSFDPPGHGLFLQASPYGSSLTWAAPLLSASLVILALTVLWSLWALRRHVQGRQAAEQALREEYAFRKAMEDSVDTGLRARDLDGRITHINPAFCRMVGFSAEELIGRLPPMPYWVDEDIESTRALHDRILAGEGPERGFEIDFKRRNGEVFTALIHEAPLINALGVQTGWISSIVDVTDAKRAAERERQQQERLQSTARLVTMGEMASSLAHELNQPLAAIASYNTGCLNLLASGQGDLKEIEAALKKSSDQAQRAGRVIRRIYEFARRAEPNKEAIQPKLWLEEVLSFVDLDARRNGTTIVEEIDAGLPEFQGDRVLLSQTLLNLIRNSIDAMRDSPHDERIITLRAQRVNEALHLRVSDRGCGVPAEIAARLFEPFYTTKTEGMGMGLAICRSVVEGHQGRLWHEPNPGGGSVFNILLPLQGKTAS